MTLMNTYFSHKHIKIKMLIIYNICLVAGYFLFILRATGRYGGNYKQNFYETLIFAFPIFLILIFLPNSWIIRKKLYRKILISDETIELVADKKSDYSYQLDALAFSVFEYQFCSVLVFYKKSIGTFEQTFYKEAADIVALSVNISWSRHQLREIADQLRYLNVEEKKEGDINIFDRLFLNNGR